MLLVLAAARVAVVHVTRQRRAAAPVAVVLLVVFLGTVVTGGWFVHPAGGLVLAWLASMIFSDRRRRNLPVMAAALGLLFALVFLGANWLVHPAAGLCVALLASVLFTRRKRHVPVILGTLAVLVALAVLGASWVAFPASGLALAWLAVVLFSGQVFAESKKERRARELRQAEAPFLQALPEASEDGVPLWESVPLSVEEREKELVTVRKGRERKRRRDEPQPASAPGAAQDNLSAIERLLRDSGGALPPEAVTRLRKLHLRGRDSLAYLREHGVAEGEGTLLARHIVSQYAPDAARAYLRLPPSTANTLPLQDGKTGRDLLIEQLDLLSDALTRVMSDATRAGGQELLAHQRFLEAKFGAGKKDFDV